MTNTPINEARLREEVLSDGEGDYTGLYEIVWSLNTKHPGLDRNLKVAAARAVMADLLRDGRVSLYRTVWASNRYDRVSQSEALSALDAPAAWADPSDEPYLCYAAV
jgi:hypothetical protein